MLKQESDYIISHHDNEEKLKLSDSYYVKGTPTQISSFNIIRTLERIFSTLHVRNLRIKEVKKISRVHIASAQGSKMNLWLSERNQKKSFLLLQNMGESNHVTVMSVLQ